MAATPTIGVGVCMAFRCCVNRVRLWRGPAAISGIAGTRGLALVRDGVLGAERSEVDAWPIFK